MACVGYLVAEPFHPLFGGQITGPANSHLGQVQEIAPFFFAFLVTAIATAELGRSIIGWEKPTDALVKNQESRARPGCRNSTIITTRATLVSILLDSNLPILLNMPRCKQRSSSMDVLPCSARWE